MDLGGLRLKMFLRLRLFYESSVLLEFLGGLLGYDLKTVFRLIRTERVKTSIRTCKCQDP